ncbi:MULTISPECIES: TMEM175 family protein [Flavobacteriaceae]|uniref:TMEM175 family protein n=1 Tax=Flavobacteriaceae TaxID=49546 RepID=UPI001491BD8F|nr:MULTISPECIES: TMEM175 family protein [Allomuricauda]MDC6366213.1 TMEM175 family protein [Muricauda sp. AC10]
MKTNRLEAFSDGVLAIIITIMVLELKVPEGNDLASLSPIIPTFVTYILSFIYLGIYWNNHHHLMHVSEVVNGKVLWANLHLLFWLSLLPFATGFMGENHFEQIPTAVYGFVLFMSSIAWTILIKTLSSHHDEQTKLRKAYKNEWKTHLSLVLYGLGTAASFIKPIFAILIYVLVAALWFIPNKTVEKI